MLEASLGDCILFHILVDDELSPGSFASELASSSIFVVLSLQGLVLVHWISLHLSL